MVCNIQRKGKMNQYGAPEDVVDCLQRYVEHRMPTGGFLEAVLCNDLREACGHADNYNRHKIFEIVSYCWNELPYNCWGSPERVNNWLEGKDENG